MPDRHQPVLLTLLAVCVLGFGTLTVVIVQHQHHAPAVDLAVLNWVGSIRRPDLTGVAAAITSLGSPWTLTVVGLVTAAWLRFTRVDTTRLLVTIGAWVATAGLVTIVKVLVARERPPIQGLVGSPALDYAFPSGHTTDSAVIYLLVAQAVSGSWRRWIRRTVVGAAALLAIVIAGTRLYLGYHWLTDVLGGWLLAGAILTLTALVLQRSTAGADTDRVTGRPGRPAGVPGSPRDRAHAARSG